MRLRITAVLACAVAVLVPVAAAEAAFPGANGRIVFSSDRGGTFDIWSMNADGSDPVQLTNHPGFENTPAWSPDGQRIAFARSASISPLSRQREILVMNADGSEETRLATGPQHESPAWSPDGTRIAFASTSVVAGATTFDLMMMDADGTNVRPLLAGPQDEYAPAWAPDGTQIAFTGERGGSPRVLLVNPDGTGLSGFAGDPSGLFFPEWSPDAAWIAADTAGRIVKISRDRTQRITLSDPPGGDFAAAWSPDGTQIAFESNRDPGDMEIWVMDQDGGNARPLTVNADHDFQPDWQPLVNAPPDCSGVRAAPASLWPPNKHLRTVTLSGATDADGNDFTLRVTGVTHDEGGASGWQRGPSPDRVLLRAERDPKGGGRVYTVAFEATDEHGSMCAGAATVAVPRHKK